MAHRLAVLVDYAEEGWTSMDLCAEMFIRHLDGQGVVRPVRVSPAFRRRAQRLPVPRGRGALYNADRLINRFWDYPRVARGLRDEFDFFHVCDHSYSQLVHVLPPERAGVYCHDLDAFRCLLDPARDPRPRWFRALARRILTGMQKAGVVFHNTAAVGQQIVRSELVPSDRLIYAPLGVAPEFAPFPSQPAVEVRWLAGLAGRPWVAHVGSCVPRKRIDVLLDVAAAVRAKVPDLRLVKVGGVWTADHRERIARLGLAGAITQVGGLARSELAEVYRRAAVVLVPSEAEGFGLPVIEALACGAAVVASDIPALREAGGPAAAYAPVGDVGAWADAVAKVLTDPAAAPPRAGRLAWAARFSWAAHAETIARAYHRLLLGFVSDGPHRPCGSPS
ncbi:MAG: glycosyltransferase [Planctomycetaceae bacterium]|nr:glycosyltransferase [Planctomycetaceae bacterium]MBV8606536.1 glycosyltransferase [Singulisphaera sp.]